MKIHAQIININLMTWKMWLKSSSKNIAFAFNILEWIDFAWKPQLSCSFSKQSKTDKIDPTNN